MVKTFNFFKRKPGLSVEDFHNYWLREHAAVIRAIPEVRKYVASIAIPSSYRNSQEPISDGVSEVWFDDEEVIRATADSTPRRAATADDAMFVDVSKTGAVVTDEILVKDGAAPVNALKVLSMLTRKDGMEVAAFQAYWRESHGPLASRLPQTRRYVQCPVRASGYADGRMPRYDGVAEVWFDDFNSMVASASAGIYEEVRADEAKFIALPFGVIFASEHRIV